MHQLSRKDDQKILKAAAAEIDFMGVNYYQSCVCEYNPMDGVTPYGTMNTTGVERFCAGTWSSWNL